MSRKSITEKSAAEAERQAAFEGEVPELDRAFFEGARIRLGGRVIREAAGTFTQRGRPPLGSAAKVQQSLRLSPEVLDYFRATGPGWQARIDEVLKRHVETAGGMKGRVAGAQAARAQVAEERSGYSAATPTSREGGASASKPVRRPVPRRPWTKPAVRAFDAGDAEAGRRDSAALSS